MRGLILFFFSHPGDRFIFTELREKKDQSPQHLLEIIQISVFFDLPTGLVLRMMGKQKTKFRDVGDYYNIEE
jgi:hypothetical protein